MTQDELVEIIGAEIERPYSFRMSLVRLVDGVSTYELITDDGRWEFGSNEAAYEKLAALKGAAKARAILSALSSKGLAVVKGWQPADTGPWSEDGKRPQYVLVSNGLHTGVGYRAQPNYEGDPEWYMEDGDFISPPVTNWMPLPAARPKEGA